MMLFVKWAILVGLFIHLIQCVSSYHVLVVITTISYSHFKAIQRLIQELTNRGHKVTFLSNHAEKISGPNVVAIDGKSCSIQGMPDAMVDEILTGTVPIFVYDMIHFYDNILVSECYVKSNSFQQLLKSNQSFDLVIVEYFNFRLFTELGHVFEAPVIHYSSLIPPPWVAMDYGYPMNPSYISNFLGNAVGKMSFAERLRNTVEVSIMLLVDRLMMSGRTQEIVGRYYPGSRMPSMDELTRNSSLLLVNTHHTLSGVRPGVPNVVEIGGIHIVDAKKLPQVKFQTLNNF